MIGSTPSKLPTQRRQLSLLLIFIFSLYSISGAQAQQIRFKKDIYPLLLNQQFEEAKPLLQQFLTYEPQHTDATYWLAKSYEHLGIKNLSTQEMQNAANLMDRASSLFTKKDFGLLGKTTIPEAAYFVSADKVEAFKYFLTDKAIEMRAVATALNPHTIIDTFLNMKEVQQRLGITLPEELANLTLNNFPLSYQLVTYEGRSKLEGLIQMETTSIADLLQVYYQAEMKDNQIIDQHCLTINHLQRIKKDLEFVPLEHISDLLNVEITPYVNQLFGYFEGYIHYITIDSNAYLDGPFYFEYQEAGVLPIYGTLTQQNGFIDIINHNWDEYDQVGFRLKIEDGAIARIDFERVQYDQPDYETGTLSQLDPTRALELKNANADIVASHSIISNDVRYFQLVELKTIDAELPSANIPSIIFSDSTQQQHTLWINELQPITKERLLRNRPINEWFQVEMEVRQIQTNILPKREFKTVKSIHME